MVSVLLASYNGEKYIGRQIDSILNQTKSDIKLLISDDLSSDGTPQILREYKEKNPDCIEILNNDEESGSARDNFFRLLKAGKGDYLMLSDQDDIWLPHKAEVTLREMLKQEKKWGRDMPILVHGDLSVADENEVVLHKSMVRYQKIAVWNNRLSHYLVENNITGNTVMINRSFLRKMGEAPRTCVMHDWWLGLFASCFGKISYIDSPLVLYRQHGNNQVGAKSGMEQVAGRIKNRERVRDNYQKLFLQAEEFLNCYGSVMGREQKETVEEFIKLKEMNRLQKIQTIYKYNFYKSTPLRTLGQMLSI